MLTFILRNWQLIFMVVLYVVVGVFARPLLFALLPLSVFFMKARELWADMIFGLLIVLVLSDITPWFFSMQVFKGAKNTYVVALAAIFLLERYRFVPFSQVFNIFLPFFIYSIFPLVFSNNMVIGVQKTLSYALMYLVVPNYILYNYRIQGWSFFRNLVFFTCTILLGGLIIPFFGDFYASVGGRFRGLFGNPNGMAIFCFLSILLFSVLSSINRSLFSWKDKLAIYAVLGYFLIVSGSRASLTATAIFLIFQRFFAYSPLLGFVILLAVFTVGEIISSNLEPIIRSLGLEDYFRLETLEDGSGRYFAWQFSWQQVQDYIVFGGGFGNDERIMRKFRLYLEQMGHQGGVHNSYLSFWLNVGAVGLILFLRGFFLLFFKASKVAPISIAVMFAVLFSIMYESWLVGSLNPYTIVLLIIMTVVSEPEIVDWRPEDTEDEPSDEERMEPGQGSTARLALPSN